MMSNVSLAQFGYLGGMIELGRLRAFVGVPPSALGRIFYRLCETTMPIDPVELVARVSGQAPLRGARHLPKVIGWGEHER
jgi:hypothetical protein